MNASHFPTPTEANALSEQPDDAEPAQAQWDIHGLTCAADATRLERHLRAIPGVISVVVNPVVERAYVTFDASRVSPQELLDGVSDAGFGTP